MNPSLAENRWISLPARPDLLPNLRGGSGTNSTLAVTPSYISILGNPSSRQCGTTYFACALLNEEIRCKCYPMAAETGTCTTPLDRPVAETTVLTAPHLSFPLITKPRTPKLSNAWSFLSCRAPNWAGKPLKDKLKMAKHATPAAAGQCKCLALQTLTRTDPL